METPPVTTLAKLLAQRQQLIERLEEGPGPHEREEIERLLAEIEEELIRFALRFYRGQMSQVARKLGIGRSTLYRKLKDYGIDPDNPMHDAA